MIMVAFLRYMDVRYLLYVVGPPDIVCAPRRVCADHGGDRPAREAARETTLEARKDNDEIEALDASGLAVDPKKPTAETVAG